MAGVKGKSGGRRPGAGRPCKSGCVTKVMRVPSYMKQDIETFIEIQTEWLSDEDKKPIGYLDEVEEKRRRDFISNIESLIYYEKKRLARAYQLKISEEDKRQLKLF
ncbi:hypothetical protein PL757_20515 [Phocaeicola vulgatus]|uniref:hypothetical protein n=1 Tax=Phocaeicola vulgatus TaxID=821 RepID=UPI00189ED3DE|nr:hypothetical protein [Phocaeicola vulgatus]MDB1077503.1 hypothetical protein [Phocaeicola vulgatus]